MSGYILSEPARRDLHHIRDYIAQDNVVAARKVVQEIRAAFQMIARMPEIGHTREDLIDTTYRFWPVRSYLIIYRSETNRVQIVRVLHGARDIPPLF